MKGGLGGEGQFSALHQHTTTIQEHTPEQMKAGGQVPEDTLSLATQLGDFSTSWTQQPCITGLLGWRPRSGLENHLTSQASKEDPVPQPIIPSRRSTVP